MPSFFFDMHDDGIVIHDFYGADCESIEVAIAIAKDLIQEVRRHDLPSDSPRPFAIEVRDDTGAVVHLALL